MTRPAPPGLYESLLTDVLESVIRERGPHYTVETGKLEVIDAPAVLARHVGALLERALEALGGGENPSEHLARQVSLANEVVSLLRSRSLPIGEQVAEPPRQLLAIRDSTSLRATPPRPPIRLSDSALLVNAHDEPRIGAALKAEIASADRIDLICAFVKWSGLRLLERELADFCGRGGRLRVLTTTYLGATEARAIERLRELGAAVRVSYDTETTRLHAKSWLFHRETGFSTAYVGSSNLSGPALLDGLEWNVRLSAVTLPDVLRQVAVAFESYWNSVDFREYDATTFAAAIAEERGADLDIEDGTESISGLRITPWPHQQRILEELDAERGIRGIWRNLVVAATGTGKTLVAAFDYERMRRHWGGDASLLFVAHRGEILRQSRRAFREVLGDPGFGELWVAGDRPLEGRHCFASVQTLANVALDRIAPGAFDVVIVDEVHRSAAPTYARWLEHLRPRLLLGLTATPERTDGVSILDWFDGRISSEIRLWEALERSLLSPFHYFGVADGEDLSDVGWTRGGYDVAGLDNVFVFSRERALRRVRVILNAIRAKVLDPSRMRALGFCASVAHARFMADQFSGEGLAAVAVTGDTAPGERQRAVEELRAGRLRAIFSVDVFNEGVDIPEVDTVIFLRPTESSTVFLQQLGRGLRRTREKSCLTVLDFVSTPNRRFRFDQRYRALLGGSKSELVRNVEQGFPHVPPGCVVDLDRESSRIVLASLKSALGAGLSPLVDAVREAGEQAGLADLVSRGEFEVRDLYRKRMIDGIQRHTSWTLLRRLAGYSTADGSPAEDEIAKGIGRLLHVDDPERIGTWRESLAADVLVSPGSTEDIRRRRLLAMLHFLVFPPRDPQTDTTISLARIWREPALRRELLDLLSLLEASMRRRTRRLEQWPDVPIHLHASYTRDEILAAFGLIEPGRHVSLQAGVRWDATHACDLLFVTLEKSESHYSPKTRYRDFPVSPILFHWESQHTTSAESATGRRYRQHRQQGSDVLLFVRDRHEDERGVALPYLCLGFADYVSHEGERPMSILWQLRSPMPAELFEQARRAA